MSKPLYGSQTRKAIRNFPISGMSLPSELIHALAAVKAAAAEVNGDLGKLNAKHARSIARAAEEIIQGKHDSQFPVDVFQTGSGTSTNMNVNEVIASLAGKGVHPNDHVNMGQSSNDVFPTALHVTSAVMLKEQLIPALKEFRKTLTARSKTFAKVVKVGRTHLQEAVPVTLGQEFSGYARQIELGIERTESVMMRLIELPIGGTAVGTGLNTNRRFGKLVAGKLGRRYGLKFREAANHFEANANRTTCLEMSGALKTLAIDLRKIADDIRWMAALGEISLPELQPGSSMMPGKVNPVFV